MTNAFIVLQANAFSTGKNALCVSDERYIAGDERVENARSNFNPTQLHVATSDFQTELLSRLLLTGTHLRKCAVATLSNSPASTLHPQVFIRNGVLCWTKQPSS